jgi:8-oxo-dGTP pyrophosphatase MutT (NUDIX family)
MNERTMYCNNCGEKGHVFRTCKEPVISCGLLFLRGVYEPLELPIDPKLVSVLMVRRKDSMSYMEFIRGKYELSDEAYIKRQLSNMTVTEQRLILNEEFKTLWTKLWGNGRDTESIEFELARDKFNTLDKKRLISEVPSRFQEPEWGFPKGRRMRGESDVQCAMREFFEETNIPNDAYKVLENTFLTESFIGTNNIKYKHVYYVALLKDSTVINLKQKLTVVQRREISSVAWKTLAECRDVTRPHYVERKKMITELERIVSLGVK